MLRRLLDRVVIVAMAVAELAMLAMMLHVVLTIVLRYAFRIALDSVPEITAFYYMAGMIFLGFAWVTRTDGHIAASLFTDRMPRRLAELLQGVILIVLAIACYVLARETWGEAVRMTRIGEFHQGASINLPKWPTRWFAPAGFGLMGVVALVLALDRLIGRPTPPLPGAAPANPE